MSASDPALIYLHTVLRIEFRLEYVNLHDMGQVYRPTFTFSEQTAKQEVLDESAGRSLNALQAPSYTEHNLYKMYIFNQCY